MQLDAMAGTSIGSSDPKVVGDARRMATRDDVGHGWYPECGGHMFGLERLSAEEKARQDKMNSAAFQEAEEELAAESITVWAQLVRFLFGGAQPDQHLQEPLKWRVATTNNGLCAIAKRQAGSVGVCFTVGGRHARTVDVDLKLLKSVDECAWNTEGNLLACCCHGSAQVIVLRVNVATQSVSKVGQLVELGGEHGVVASIHFRSSSELVVISNQACILRVAVSGEPDVRPLPPTYFVGNPGVEFSRTLNIGGGAVQRTALWKTKSDDVFFGPKGGDVLTLACDENLFLILLLDSAPYFERIRELPIRAPGDPSPPGALGFLTPLGISRIPQRERVVQLALSPTGQYLASLTRGGRLIVRYSGLQFNAAAPTDLGNAVVARSDVGETVLDVAWWDEHHLILAKKETSSSYGKLALVPLEDPLPKTSLLVETLDSRLSRPMSLAAAGSRSSSALAFALTCDKQWIPQDEQRPPNATILKGGYLLLRHYRLSAIVGRSPPELYKHYLQKADFEQAQILLDNFGLDADLMTKAQWENASPKTTVHIRQTLALVKDLDWVLDQCVNQLPFSEDAVRALLDLGIERCTQSETSLSESQTSIMREIENLRYRLDVFLAIRGEQGYEAVEFSIFRTQDIARIAREAAEEGHVGTVHKLVSAFPVDLAPELLSVLSCFPETTSPMEYADILPAYDPTISANVYQILGADGSVKPIANMDPLPFVVSRLETIAEWYTHRILEIDQASGMLDLALELSQCANVRLESCAADPAGVQLNLLVQNTRDLDRLVYQTGLRDTLTLSSWNMMDEYARLCVAVDGTTSNSIVKVMSARALPWYRNLQPPPLITWLGHVRRYLRARSRGLEDPRDMPVSGTPVSNDGAYIAWDLDSAREGIALCAEVIYQSRPLSVNEGGLPRQDRLIPLSTALIETALACCYACPVPDARTSFDKIFQSLPARQPEIESKVPALAALQDRVELLDTHLDVNSQLETFASAVPLQFFVDCCQADEARRAEKLLASGIPQEESKTLEQLMTNDQNIEDTRWMIGDGHSEASGPYTPAAEQERVSEDDRNEVLSAGLNSKRAESEPGAALVLRVLDQASKHEGADRKYWDQALAAVWSLRKALPYLSRRFIARQCLFTLLRAGQFDVAHELIIDMDEAAGENSILSREEMEELVIEVSQEYFNSSADYGSQEMAKAKQVLKTLPFAASQRVQTEANLVQILDLLSNQLGAPMVPLQVRMFIASESPEEIIDKVLEANPTLYKSDSKLLRLAYLMGLDAPDQSASIRLRVLKAALSHHDLETAQRLVVSMVEKANVLLEGNKTPAVERTAQVSAEACLHLANSGLLKQLDDSKKYALHALLLARDGETSRDALATMESIETPENSDVALANLPWVSVFEGDSGMVSFRKLRRACPVAWATSELAHNPHLATMALAEIISYNPDAIVQVDECLDYLQQAMQSPEASSKQTQIIHSALRAVAVAATASSDAPVAILQEPPSKVLRRLSSYLPTLKEKDDDLHRLAQRLCENCKALSDNHSLLRLLPHANIALFKSDEKYRKRSLMDAARALGHAFEPLDGASWLGLVELAEECGGASRWDLDAARVAGLILSGAPVKEIESQLRKDDGLTRLLEQRAATQSMLSKLWRGIDGTNYEQLLIVENLMLRALDDDSNEEEHKRLKDRRAFLRRIEKLAYHPNAKLFLCMPLAENETVDRETALVEIDRLMDKKNVKRLAKLLSSNVECLPKLRPSEIVLHFCCHLLGVGSSTMDQNSQVPRNLLTEVTQSAAMAGRQTYKSSCAELVHILVPIDIVSLAQRCAALGGVLDLLDLDLRETIIQDCRTALLSAINRKPVDNADELLATLNQAGAFLQGIRFLLENLDLDRPNSTQLINNLEKSGLSADLIQMAFEGAALSGGCSAEVLVHACAAMEMSPVTMFHDISNHVLNQPDTSMDEISALVSITSYLIDLQSDDERATGESMLRALREFTSESSSEKLRIDVLKLLSLAGLDQDGDQELMQNLKALRSVQDIWPLTLTSDIHIDQVGSVQQRCELLKDLGCPEDATSRLRVAHLLLEWEALSAEKLPFGDFYHSVQFHAQKVASGLITKYVSPEVPLSSQVDFTSRLSAYSEVWEGLFQIAAENNEKEFLNSIRYSIDGIALLSEAAENDLSQTHDLPVFGLFSGYYKVRTSAETSLWKQDAIDLDNDDDLVQLVLVTCILTTVPSELLQPLSERSLKLAQFSNISSQPLAWSPIYLALIFCLRGEFVEAGQVILHANNTPKLMCSGSAWHVALRHAIMQASLCEIQGLGWEFAAELASVALMRFNESCCQDRQESSSFLSFLKQASKVVESHEEVESGDNWDDSWDNEDANARPDVQSNVAKIDPGKSEVNSISGWQVEDDDLDFGEGDKSLTKETLIQSALQDTTQTADTNTGWGGDDEDNLDFEEDDKGSAGETLNQSAMRDPVHASTITGSGTGWGKDEDEDLSFEEDDKASAGESLLQSAMRDPAQASTDAGTGTGPGWGDDEDEDLSFEEDDKGSAGESLNQSTMRDPAQASTDAGTGTGPGWGEDEDEDLSFEEDDNGSAGESLLQSAMRDPTQASTDAGTGTGPGWGEDEDEDLSFEEDDKGSAGESLNQSAMRDPTQASTDAGTGTGPGWGEDEDEDLSFEEDDKASAGESLLQSAMRDPAQASTDAGTGTGPGWGDDKDEDLSFEEDDKGSAGESMLQSAMRDPTQASTDAGTGTGTGPGWGEDEDEDLSFEEDDKGSAGESLNQSAMRDPTQASTDAGTGTGTGPGWGEDEDEDLSFEEDDKGSAGESLLQSAMRDPTQALTDAGTGTGTGPGWGENEDEDLSFEEDDKGSAGESLNQSAMRDPTQASTDAGTGTGPGWGEDEDEDLSFEEDDKASAGESLLQSAMRDPAQASTDAGTGTGPGWGDDKDEDLSFEEDDKGSAGESMLQSAMRDPTQASTDAGTGTGPGWGKDEDEDLSFEEDDEGSAGESLNQSAMRDPAQASTDAGTGTGPGWGDDEDEDLSFEEDDKGSAGESLNQRATADSVQASRVVGTSSGCDQDEDEDASSGGDVSNCLTSHTSHTFSEHQDQIPNSIEGNYLEDKRSVHDNKLRLDGHNDDETTTEKKCIQTTMDGAVVEDYLPSTTSGWPNGDEDGSDLDFSEAGESSLRPEAISSPSQTDMETLKLVASGQQNVNFNVAKDFKTNMAPNDDPPVTEEGQASNVVDDESDFDMNGSSVVMDFSKEGAGDSMVHSSASIIANGRPQKEDADLSIEEPKSSNDDLCLQDDLISRSQDQILETNEAGGEQIGKYPGSSLTRCVNNSEGKETSHMESDVPTFEVGESKTVSNLAAQTSTSSDATGWASEGEDDLDVVEKNYSGSNDDSAQTLMSTGAQALAPLGGAGWVDDDDADDVEFDQEASGTYESSLQDEGHKEGEALHVDQASRLSSMLSADWVDDGSDEDDTDNAHFTSESGNQKSFPIDPPANISSENTAEDSEVDIDELLEFSGQKESHTESDLQVALNSGSWEDESDDLNFGREDPELSEEVEVVDDSDKINREEEPYSNDTADEYSSDKEPGWESDQHDFHADIDSKLSEKELTVSSVEEAVEAGQVALFSNDHDAAVAQNSENEQNPAENAIQDFITTSFQSGDTGCLEHEEPKDKPAETSSIQGDDEHKNSLAKFVGLGKQEEQEEEEDAFHQSEVIHENEEHDGITKLSCEQKKCDEANAEVQVAKDIDDKEASEAAKEISSLNVSYPPVHASDEVSEVSKSSFDDSVSNAEGPEPPLSSVTIVSNHQMRSMVEDEGYIGLSDEGEEPVKKVEDCEEFGNNQNSLNTIADNADDSCNPKEAPSTDDNESGLFDQGCEALKDRQISKGGWDDQSSLGDIDEEDAVVDGTSQEASNDTTYEGELFEQDDDLLKESTGVEGGWEDQSSLGDIDGDAENCDTMKATNNDAKQAEVFQPDDESLKDSKKSERAWEDQSSLGDVDVIDADSVQVSSTDAPAETFLRDDTSRGVTRHSTSDLSDGLAPTAITGESSGWQDNESDIDAGSVSSRSSHASVTVRQMPSSEAEISTGRDAEYHSFPAETMHGAPSAENGANASGDIDDLAIGGNASTMDRLARGLEGIDLSQDFPSPSSADHSSPAEGATGHSNSSQEDLAGEGTASSFQEHQHVASTDHDGGLESSEIQHRVTSTNAGGAHGGADHNASEVTFEERRQGFFEDENEDEEYSSSESNLDRTSEEVRELGTIVADENGDTNEARLAREDVAHDEVHEDDIHQSAGVEAGMELEQRQHEGGVAFEEHDPVSEIGTLTDNYGGEDDAEEAHSTTTAGEPAESGDFGSPRLLSVHARQQLREHFNAGEGSASSPFATYGGGNVNYSDDDAEAAAINASNSIAADNTENSVVEGVEARNSSSTAEDGAQETSDFGDTLTVRAGGSTGEELNGLEQLENSNDLVDAGEQTFANTRQRGGLEQSVHDVVVNEADPGDAWGLNDDLDSDGSDYGISAFGVPLGEAESNGHEETREFLHSASEQGRNLGGDVTRSQAARPHRTQSGQLPYDTTDFERLAESSHQESSAEVSPNLVASFMQEHELHREASAQSAGDQESGERGDNDNSNLANQSGWEDEDLDL